MEHKKLTIILVSILILTILASIVLSNSTEQEFNHDIVLLDDLYKLRVTGQTEFNYPGRLFDNKPYLAAVTINIGDYIEIEFNKTVCITAIREKGIGLNGDGSHDLMVFTDGDYEKILSKNTETVDGWGEWVPVTRYIPTTKAKWIATAIDTFPTAAHPNGGNWECEMEIRGYVVD